MLKSKTNQTKLENKILKNKLKKYFLQTEFLEKKLENHQKQNGSDLLLISNNKKNYNNNIVNNKCNESNIFNKTSKNEDFEQLYYEKCEEFENFGQNFDKISVKFYNVLEKIQASQCNLIEDNLKLKEFLIFILQCFNTKQFEQISCMISYAKEHQTFIAKQIFDTPVGENSLYSIEKKIFCEKSEKKDNAKFIPDIAKKAFLNYSKKENIQQEYFMSENSFEEKSQMSNSIKDSSKNLKSVSDYNIKYDNLKFSKSVSSKIGVRNKNSEKELMEVSSLSGYKSRRPSAASSKKNIVAVSQSHKNQQKKFFDDYKVKKAIIFFLIIKFFKNKIKYCQIFFLQFNL
jgi:hypothetical protein